MSDFQFNLFRKIFVVEAIALYAVVFATADYSLASCLLVAVLFASVPPHRVLRLWKYASVPADME